jgi:hypothetical protein
VCLPVGEACTQSAQCCGRLCLAGFCERPPA